MKTAWRAPVLLLSFCPCAPSEIAVPFDFIHNQIVLRAAINGQGPYNVVLDSGTHATTIDLTLARRLGLPLSGARSSGQGAGAHRVVGQPTVCDELRVGDLAVRKLSTVALDLSGISRTMGRPLHAVLGFSFLDSRIVQIDYFHRCIHFYAESPFAPTPFPPPTARRISFPMQFLADSVLPVLLECRVNGVSIPVTIDTGSSLGLILFPGAIERLGLGELARQGTPLEAAGYRGQAQLSKGWVRSLALDSIDLGAVEVAYVGKDYGDREDLARRGGNLGNALLQDFVLTLDYRSRVVVMEANPE
jgi:hypothetical protein